MSDKSNEPVVMVKDGVEMELTRCIIKREATVFLWVRRDGEGALELANVAEEIADTNALWGELDCNPNSVSRQFLFDYADVNPDVPVFNAEDMDEETTMGDTCEIVLDHLLSIN